MALKTRLTLAVNALLSNPLDLASVPVAPLDKTWQPVLTSGTGAGQADRLWFDERTLAASATEDLDLAGTLEDALGGAFVLARVKSLIVSALATNTNNVVVGAAAATPWSALLGATGTLTVRPGATVAVACGEGDATGYTVGAGASDLLKIANSAGGTEVKYQIVIIGASA